MTSKLKRYFVNTDCGRIESMTDVDICVTVQPSVVMQQLVEFMDQDDVLSLILEMDLMMADVEFTEKLIKKLKKSLKKEFREYD